MKGKNIIQIILIVLLTGIQLSFIGALPGILRNLNLSLVILVFISALGKTKTTLWSAIGMGLLFDLYGLTFFGVNLLGLFLSAFGAKFFWDNYFTDRSLYSFLAITFFTNIIFRVIVYLFFFIAYIFGQETFSSLLDFKLLINELWGIGLNLLITIFIFYFVAAFSSDLKPVFLSRKRWN